MTVNRYYRQEWAPEGIDPNILEKTLGATIEPDAKNAFQRLLAKPVDFSDTETATVLTYLELQRIRVPRQAKMAKQLLRSVIVKNSPTDAARAIAHGEVRIKINDSFRFDYMRMLIGTLHPWFARMKWEVIKAVEGSAFITTDSPVTFYNVDFIPPTEAGIGLAGTSILFPLNSETLLILRHPEYMSRLGDPSKRLPEPALEDKMIEITYGDIWTDQQVNRINWVMYQLSDRLVAGKDKSVLEACVGYALQGHK